MNKIHAQIVGVLNCSPDSFSDGRRYDDDTMRVRIQELIADGADRLDVWGEATAPGLQRIDEQGELDRLDKFFRQMSACTVPFSVDTIRARVAQEAITCSADMINDVSGGRFDPDMISLVVEHPHVRYILVYSSYWNDRPPQLQEDITDLASRFFEERIAVCERAGMKRENIILDPGLGVFISPDPTDSIRVLRAIPTLRERFGLPIHVSASHKNFLSAYSPDRGPRDRIGSSIAASAAAALEGADYLRVHDVRVMRQFLSLWNTIHE